jgi:peptidoglycan L-alanyl-D-glutamate endopeptidase CwlK
MYKFGIRSISRLQGVHPDLVRVMEKSITNSPHDFSITEGLRTSERQRELVAQGASRTLMSRHLTGHAVDIAIIKDGKAVWDFPLYQEVADHIKKVADAEGVPLIWGGDWRSLKDGVHFELNRKHYPA